MRPSPLLLLLAVCLLVGCDGKPKPYKKAELPDSPTIYDILPEPGGGLLEVPAHTPLSPAGYKLILDYEVGGGKPYYDKLLKHPTWPGLSSGVTIGVGYDLGYNSKDVIEIDWAAIPYDDLVRLSAVAGYTGNTAKEKIKDVNDIVIEWKLAEGVFNDVTLGKFYELTENSFPGFDDLRPNAKAALVATIFNRGASFYGTRRVEMRAIREMVPTQDYEGMATELEKMKRLWPDTLGLRRRYDATANLMRTP